MGFRDRSLMQQLHAAVSFPLVSSTLQTLGRKGAAARGSLQCARGTCLHHNHHVGILGQDRTDGCFSLLQLNIIMYAETASHFEQWLRSGLADQNRVQTSWPLSLRAGRFIPAVEYVNVRALPHVLLAGHLTCCQLLPAAACCC